ncbi:MAG TPA: hypothetical protein VK932_24825 [Kofleriaceae bacterium]|nr:hypothetical protein [Kofleriaceae bacterium]
MKFRTSTVTRWVGGAAVCAVVVVIVALLTPDHAPPPADQGERRATGTYRPGGTHRPHAVVRSRAGGAERGDEEALSPELEARVRAAAHVATAPAPTSSGAPLPPTGPLPPDVQAEHQQALTGWQAQAQALLDACVARPAAERKPVPLDIFFAPPPEGNGLAAQQLSPVAVSVPLHELQRLWRDTDPDELQGCLDQVRTLALPVATPPKMAAQVLPASMATLLVQL